MESDSSEQKKLHNHRQQTTLHTSQLSQMLQAIAELRADVKSISQLIENKTKSDSANKVNGHDDYLKTAKRTKLMIYLSYACIVIMTIVPIVDMIFHH